MRSKRGQIVSAAMLIGLVAFVLIGALLLEGRFTGYTTFTPENLNGSDPFYVGNQLSLNTGIYDFALNANSIAITFNDSIAVLDCNGSTIRNTNTSEGKGIVTNGNDDLIIKNCTILDFDIGIYVNGSTQNITIIDSNISGNNVGIKLNNSDDVNITRNVFDNTALSYDLEITSNSNNNNISNNYFYGNGVSDSGGNSFCTDNIGNFYDEGVPNIPSTECDVSHPEVNLTSLDGSIFGIASGDTLYFNYTVNESGNVSSGSLANCSLYLWLASGSIALNETNSSPTNNALNYFTKSNSSVNDGIYNWTVRCSDNAHFSNSEWAVQNHTFTKDQTYPPVPAIWTLSSPTSDTSLNIYGHVEEAGVNLSVTLLVGGSPSGSASGTAEGQSTNVQNCTLNAAASQGASSVTLHCPDGEPSDSYYIEFAGHNRTNFLRYDISSHSWDNPTKLANINLAQSLDQAVSNSEAARLYNSSKPTGWFNVSATLDCGGPLSCTTEVRVYSIDSAGNQQPSYAVGLITLNESSNISYQDFDNSLTTNFSNYTAAQLENISNVTIGIPGKGLINFSNQQINISGVNLDSLINISDNYVEIRTDLHEGLNASAIITLFNLDFANQPAVLKDGAYCSAPECVNLSWDGENFTFNVSHFTSYAAGSNSQLKIYDDGDLNPPVSAGGDAVFYAEYNQSDGTPISPSAGGGNCSINFSDSPATFFSMNYVSGHYNYSRVFNPVPTPFTYQWSVNCTSTSYEALNTSDDITIAASNPPSVALVSPPDNHNTNEENVTFTCSLTDDSGLSNVTLYTDLFGTWIATAINTSISGTSATVSFTLTPPSDGSFIWNCLAYDTHNNSAFNDTNYTLNRDTDPPIAPHLWEIDNTNTSPVNIIGYIEEIANITVEARFPEGKIYNTNSNTSVFTNPILETCDVVRAPLAPTYDTVDINCSSTEIEQNDSLFRIGNFVSFSNHNRTYFANYNITNSSLSGLYRYLQIDPPVNISIPLYTKLYVFNHQYPTGWFNISIGLIPSVTTIRVWGLDNFSNPSQASEFLLHYFNANLTIFDTDDLGTIVYKNAQAYFFANYTNLTGQSIPHANCSIKFSDQGFRWMEYNTSSGYYQYNRSFTIPNGKEYNVTCKDNSTPTIYETFRRNGSIPIFSKDGPIPPILWETGIHSTNEETLFVVGYVNDSINVTVEARDSNNVRYASNTQNGSEVFSLITACTVNSSQSAGLSALDVFCPGQDNFTIGRYIEFEGHSRVYLNRYNITFAVDSGLGKYINISPSLESSVSEGERVFLYASEYPSGWFNISLVLNPGFSTVRAFGQDQFGQNGDISVLGVSFIPIPENASLRIWDNATISTLVNDSVIFYANFTNGSSGASITGALCNITIEGFATRNMTYNSSLELYFYNRSFNQSGTYEYNISCYEINFGIYRNSSSFTVFDVDTSAPPEPKVWWPYSAPRLVTTNRIDVIGYTNRTNVYVDVFAYQFFEDPKANMSNLVLNLSTKVGQSEITTDIGTNSSFVFVNESDAANFTVGRFIEFEGHNRSYFLRYNITGKTNFFDGTYKISISPNLEEGVTQGERVLVYDSLKPTGWFNLSLELFNGTNDYIRVRSRNLFNISSPVRVIFFIHYDYIDPVINLSIIPGTLFTASPTITFNISDDFGLNLSTLLVNISNSSHSIYHAVDSSLFNQSLTFGENITCQGSSTVQRCSFDVDLGLGQYNLSAAVEDLAGRQSNASKSFWLNLSSGVIYTNFDNFLTTNFSQFSEADVNNISNVTIGIPGLGLIDFGDQYLNFSGANLDAYVNISSNYISINTTALPQLNTSATITLFNLNFEKQPIPLLDGEFCDTCTVVSWDGSDFVFNVTHFSSYSAGANAQLEVWDQEDSKGGNNLIYNNTAGVFYANYTNRTGGSPINDSIGQCNITILSNTNGMLFSYATNIYTYNASFNLSGSIPETYDYNVACSSPSFESLSADSNFTVYPADFTPPPQVELWSTATEVVGTDNFSVIGYIGVPNVYAKFFVYNESVFNPTNPFRVISPLITTESVKKAEFQTARVTIPANWSFFYANTTDISNISIGDYVEFSNHQLDNFMRYRITNITYFDDVFHKVHVTPNITTSLTFILPFGPGTDLVVYNSSVPSGWFNISVPLFNGTSNIFAYSMNIFNVTNLQAGNNVKTVIKDYQDPIINLSRIVNIPTDPTPTISFFVTDDTSVDNTTLTLDVYSANSMVRHVTSYHTRNTSLYNYSDNNISCGYAVLLGTLAFLDCLVDLNLTDGSHNFTFNVSDDFFHFNTAVYNNYFVDSTQPMIIYVNDYGDITVNQTLSANWTVSNPASALRYQYALGEGAYPSNMYNSTFDWRNTTSTNISVDNYTLIGGAVYYFSVRAVYFDGSFSEVVSSNGILFEDVTPPVCTPPGDCIHLDGLYTNSNFSLHASWNFTDPNSAVMEYEFAIGNNSYPFPGWESVVPRVRSPYTELVEQGFFIPPGTPNDDVTIYGLNLMNGETYGFSVKARNRHGTWNGTWSSYETWNVSLPGDGITVDVTAPVNGSVIYPDGFLALQNITISFDIGADEMSGVKSASLLMAKSPLPFGEDNTCLEFSDYGSVYYNESISVPLGTVTKTVDLDSGYCYSFRLRVRDVAGNYKDYNSPNEARALKIDSTPPATVNVSDEGFYTYYGEYLYANWTPSFDNESGIAYYIYEIYKWDISLDPLTDNEGNWTFVSQNITAATEVYATSFGTDKILLDEYKYYFRIIAVNGVGNFSLSSDGMSNGSWSNGIIYLDDIPPDPVVVLQVENDTNGTDGWIDNSDDNSTVVVSFGEAWIRCVASKYDIDYSEGYGNVLCNTTAAGSGSNVTCNISNMWVQGNYTYYITCKDSVGNKQLAYQNTQVDFVLDWPDPPQILNLTITPSPAYVTNTLLCNGTFFDPDSGDFKAGESWQWYVGNISIAGASLGTLNLSSSAYSSYNISRGDNITCVYNVTDNTGLSNSENTTITINNSRPSNVTLISPADGVYLNGLVLFNWTAAFDADNDTIIYLGQVFNQSNLSSLVVVIPVSDTNLTNNVSLLADGLYSWRVEACDNSSASNNCSLSNVSTFNVDSTPPSIVITNPSAGEIMGGLIQIMANINDSLGVDSAWFSIFNASSVEVANGTLQLSSGIEWDGTWLTNITAYPDGNYTLVVYANDSIGNQNSASQNFNLSNTGPSIDFLFPNFNNKFFNSNFSLNISVQNFINTSYNITNSSGDTVQFNTTNFALQQAYFEWNDLVPATLFGDGMYTIEAFARDVANNTRTKNFTFYLDTHAPIFTAIWRTPDPIYDDMDVWLNVTWPNPFNLDANLYELAQVIISYNINGTWINNSVLSNTDVFSYQIQASELLNNNTVYWRSFATDFTGNQNQTPIMNFTVLNRPPAFGSLVIISSQSGSNPAIYNNSVVYQDSIKLYDILSNTTTNISNATSAQLPDIHEDLIVWQEIRNTTFDVFLYNISSSTETRITNNNSAQRFPAVYGDIVVWDDARLTNNRDIYLYYVSNGTEQRITTNDSNQIKPEIYEDIIVWMDNRNTTSPDDYDLFAYYVNNGLEERINIGVDESDATGGLAIHDNTVVWTDEYNGNFNVYSYDFDTKEKRQLTNNSNYIHYNPDVYEDFVSYIRFDGFDYEIIIHDLNNNQTRKIYNSSVSPGRPVLFEDKIVYYHNPPIDGLVMHRVLLNQYWPEDTNRTINISQFFVEQDRDSLNYSAIILPRGAVLYSAMNAPIEFERFEGTISNIQYIQGVFGDAALIESATTNLIDNNNFSSGSTDPAGWNKTGVPMYNQTNNTNLDSGAVRVDSNNYYKQSLSISAGTYTLSEYIKSSGSSAIAALQMRWKESGIPKTNILPICFTNNSGCDMAPTINASYTRYSDQITIPAGATDIEVIITAINDTIWVDNVQLEAKPYATSYTPTEREKGWVDYETPEEFNTEEGTIEFWLKPEWDGDDFIVRNLVLTGDVFIRKMATGDLRVRAAGATLKEDISGWNSDSWKHVALTWGSAVRLYINGTKVAENSTQVEVSPGDTIYLGSNMVHGAQADAVIDDFAIFNYAKNISEIQADMASGVLRNISINYTANDTAGTVTLIPAQDFIGTHSARFFASDNYSLTPTNTIYLTVTDLNDAPQWNFTRLAELGGSIRFEEDGYNDSINASRYVFDPDNSNDELNFECTSHENITVTFYGTAGSYFSNVTANNSDWYGSAVINCSVLDPEDAKTNVSIPVIVSGVNDVPVLSLPNVTIPEDTRLSFNLTNYTADIDSINSSFVFNIVQNYPQFVNCTIESQNLTLLPAGNFSGTTNCTVGVNDSNATNNFDSDIIFINVLPVNDPAYFVIDAMDDSSSMYPTNAGELVVFNATIGDPDVNATVNDTVRLVVCNISQLDPAGVCNGTGTTICITGFGDEGFFNCTHMTLQSDPENTTWYAFACDDGANCSGPVNGTFHTNHLPNATNVTLLPSVAYSFNTLNCSYVFSDTIDNDSLNTSIFKWYVNNLLNLTQYVTGTTTILGSGNITKGQTWICEVTPVDEHNLLGLPVNSSSVTILNSPPNITTLTPPTIAQESALYNYDFNVADADLPFDNLTWRINDTREGRLSVGFYTGNLVWTPNGSDLGNVSFNITVNDTSGAADSFNWTVFVNDTPNPPQFSPPIPDMTATEDVEFTYDVNCTDPDSVTIFYYDNTTEFDINASGYINWTPIQNESEDDVGINWFNVTCGDGALNTSSIFFINVSNVNDAPQWNITKAQAEIPQGIRFNEDSYNDTINASRYAYDVDNTNDELNFTCDAHENITTIFYGTPGSTFANITATFADWNGEATLNCYVFDPSGLNDILSILVNVTPVNDSPVAVISSPANNSNFVIGASITFNGSTSSDADNDALTYKWTSNINGTLGASAAITVSNLSLGTHIITLEANDSVLTDSKSITVNINPSNCNYIFNSSLNGTYYADTNVSDGSYNGSTIGGCSSIINSTIDSSTISTSTIIMSTIINSTITNSTVIDATLVGATISDAYIDPSNIYNSNVSADSNVTDSNLTDSDIDNSTLLRCNVTGSNVDDSTGIDCIIIDSQIFSSYIRNSTIFNSTVRNANITNGVIYTGTINGSIFYNATANGSTSLLNIINYAPTANAGPDRSVTAGQSISFDGSLSSDPNVPGSSWDSLSYLWEFGDGTNSTSTSPSKTYSSTGGKTVTLTVTDSFGLSDSDTATITVNALPSGDGGGGGRRTGGGGATYTLPGQYKATHIFSKITSESPVHMGIIRPNISIRDIEIRVSEPVKDVTLTVERLFEKPFDITQSIQGLDYEYDDIEGKGFDGSLFNLIILFRMSKQWLNNNSIGTDEVALYLYDNGWEELPTRYLYDDTTYNYFEAQSDEFGVVLIGTKTLGVVPPTPVPTPEPTPTPVPPTPTPAPPPTPTPTPPPTPVPLPVERGFLDEFKDFVLDNLGIIIAAFAVIVVLLTAVGLYRHYKVGRFKKPPKKPSKKPPVPAKAKPVKPTPSAKPTEPVSKPEAKPAARPAAKRQPLQKIKELQKYVFHELARGFDRERIRKKLLSTGWPENIVDDVFASVKTFEGAIEKKVSAKPTDISMVVDRIKLLIDDGYSKEEIKKMLLAKGWHESTVEFVFRRL